MSDKQVLAFLGDLAQQEKAQSAATTTYLDGAQVFKLGKYTRRGTNPPHVSGDAAIYGAHDLMHRRTREMYLNNTQIKRTTDLFRDLIVGSGINSFADPIDSSFGWDLSRKPPAEIGRSLDYALESDEAFIDWANNPKKCDVAGNLTWPEMQALTVSEAVQVGAVLLVEVTPRVPDGDVPFMIQVVEREQLDTRRDRPASNGTNQIINGIEIDAQGYEVGAWIYEVHPHDSYATMSSYDSTFVPASRYTHFYKKIRPSQHIGATWLHALGQTTVDRNQYLETEIRTAVKQALFLLAHKTTTPGSMGVGLEPDDGDETGYDIALGQNPIAAEIGASDELELLESNRPNANANNFFNLIDHDHASGVNLSYYSQTGRFDETNYGGFRGAMNLEDAQMQPIKDAVAMKVVLPIRQRWNDLAVAVGHISAITPAKYQRERKRFSRFDCVGPGRNLLDPAKELDAIVGQIRAGIATLKYACALQGRHWIRVLRQRKLETMLIDQLGVMVDLSKGNGGNLSAQPDDGSTDETAPAKSFTENR